MPAPTKTEPATRTEPEKAEPRPQRYVAPPDTSSIGGENGHMHWVDGGFIDCEACAKAAGWPAEGAPPAEPDLIVSESRAMDQ